MKKMLIAVSIWLSSFVICLMLAFPVSTFKINYNSYHSTQPNIVFWNISQNSSETLDDVIKQQSAFNKLFHFSIMNTKPSMLKEEYIPVIRGPLSNITSKDIIDLKSPNSSTPFKMLVLDSNTEVFCFYGGRIHNAVFAKK